MNQYSYKAAPGCGPQMRGVSYYRSRQADRTGSCGSCGAKGASGGTDGRAKSCPADGGEYKYGVRGFPIGSVYAPIQDFSELYEPQMALMRGTMFATLDKPFEPTGRGGRFNG